MRGRARVWVTVALLLVGARQARAEVFTALVDHRPEATGELAAEGDAAPSRVLQMQVYLAPRNRAKLDRLLDEQQDPASPDYHRWLSAAEYERRFGPTQRTSTR